MDDHLKYNFRRRSKKSSFDPYDSLTASTKSPTNLNHLLRDENYSIWTNGDTALLSKMPNESNHPIDTTGTLSTKHINSSYVSSNHHSELVQSQHIHKNMSERKNINGVHEVRNSILAGSLAGMLSVSIFHPFDVVRTKIQTSTKLKAVGATSSSSKQAAATLLSTSSSSAKNIISSSSGPLQVFTHTMRNGGLGAFYTGFSFPLTAQAAYKATVFTVNRVTKNALVDFKTREQRKTGIFSTYSMQPSDYLICGAASGFINALLFVCPVEYVRAQLIYQHTRIAEGKNIKNGVMNGPWDVVRSTFKSDGIFGLWRGAGITVLRDSVGCGCFFVSYEFGRRHLPHLTGLEPDSSLVNIGSGMFAGFGYWSLSLPLDALKTLVQSGKANSASRTLSLLVNRDGIVSATSQLYRGWQLAFGRGIPSAGITVTAYATCYHFCNTRLP
jgi:solute carrier family 25 carnitine/acylcarnitine transporter 20/29